MVSYAPLWRTMERKGITQYRMIRYFGLSNGQMHRMKKNLHVSTYTIDTLCHVLQCPIEDILEIIPEPKEQGER